MSEVELDQNLAFGLTTPPSIPQKKTSTFFPTPLSQDATPSTQDANFIGERSLPFISSVASPFNNPRNSPLTGAHFFNSLKTSQDSPARGSPLIDNNILGFGISATEKEQYDRGNSINNESGSLYERATRGNSIAVSPVVTSPESKEKLPSLPMSTPLSSPPMNSVPNFLRSSSIWNASSSGISNNVIPPSASNGANANFIAELDSLDSHLFSPFISTEHSFVDRDDKYAADEFSGPNNYHHQGPSPSEHFGHLPNLQTPDALVGAGNYIPTTSVGHNIYSSKVNNPSFVPISFTSASSVRTPVITSSRDNLPVPKPTKPRASNSKNVSNNPKTVSKHTQESILSSTREIINSSGKQKVIVQPSPDNTSSISNKTSRSAMKRATNCIPNSATTSSSSASSKLNSAAPSTSTSSTSSLTSPARSTKIISVAVKSRVRAPPPSSRFAFSTPYQEHENVGKNYKVIVNLPKRFNSRNVHSQTLTTAGPVNSLFIEYFLSKENTKGSYHEDYCSTFYKRNKHGYMFVKEPANSLKVNTNGIGTKSWVQLKVNLPSSYLARNFDGEQNSAIGASLKLSNSNKSQAKSTSRKIKVDVKKLPYWKTSSSSGTKTKRQHNKSKSSSYDTLSSYQSNQKDERRKSFSKGGRRHSQY